MKKEPRVMLFFMMILGLATISTGCLIKTLIPAPERSFTAGDLLLTEEELPPEWTIPWGPIKDTDNSVPAGSMVMNLFSPLEEGKPAITQYVSIYLSVEGAKIRFSDLEQFPGKTNIEGWSFRSRIADEEKFSCYTYSKSTYPICRWLFRYQEITMQVIGRLEPGRATLDDMQEIVKTIDIRISQKIGEK